MALQPVAHALCRVFAAFSSIAVVGHLTSIGTLFAFVLVCGGIVIMRRTFADTPRPFQDTARAFKPASGHGRKPSIDAWPRFEQLVASDRLAHARAGRIFCLQSAPQPRSKRPGSHLKETSGASDKTNGKRWPAPLTYRSLVVLAPPNG
jgi:hypothetical protein